MGESGGVAILGVPGLYLRYRQRSLQKLKRYPLNVILAIWPPDRIGNDCNCKLLTIWKQMRFLSSCHASQRYLRFRVNVMAVGDRASDLEICKKDYNTI